MSDGPWSRLTLPFPPAAVRWHAVDRSADGDRLRLAPHIAAEALRARLDEAAGPDGWSLRMTPWDKGRVIAELTVHGVARAAVACVARAPELSLEGVDGGDDAGVAATAAALGGAAALFGVVPPVRVRGDGWVDADPATGEALYPPEYVPTGEAGTGAGEARGASAAAGREHEPAAGPPHDGGESGGSDAAGSAGGEPATESATESTTESTTEPEVKPEGQRMIDRLVARLREEGMGAEAARLVTVYGGYGRDASAQRELYAKLRALLVERSART